MFAFLYKLLGHGREEVIKETMFVQFSACAPYVVCEEDCKFHLRVLPLKSAHCSSIGKDVGVLSWGSCVAVSVAREVAFVHLLRCGDS